MSEGTANVRRHFRFTNQGVLQVLHACGNASDESNPPTEPRQAHPKLNVDTVVLVLCQMANQHGKRTTQTTKRAILYSQPCATCAWALWNGNF